MQKILRSIIAILCSLILMAGMLPLTVSAEDLPVPEHSKYISSNNDGTYTLTLDVTGKKISNSVDAPIHILLIVDVSGSMSEPVASDDDPSRLSKIQELVGNLATNILQSGTNNKMAMVSFSGYQSKYVDSTYGNDEKPYDDANQVLGWTNSADNVKAAVNGLTANGGTNWEAGLLQGKTTLDSLGSEAVGASNYVVFLSDGDPTFRYSESGSTIGKGFETSAEDIGQAVAKAGQFSGTKFYSVGIGGSVYNMKTIADAAGGEYKDGSSAGALDQAFEAIESLIEKNYKNVVITDTLSKYADMVDPTKYKVTAKNAENELVKVPDGCKFVYDSKTKTVTWSFQEGIALEDGVTYSVSFLVRPSQTAINEYAEKGRTYPHRGEDGTGANSAGKAGFFSNDLATVQYDKTSGNETSSCKQNYAKPVLQVLFDPIRELPKAGGSGTWWLYVIGFGMIGFAGTLLIIQKKRQNKENGGDLYD